MSTVGLINFEPISDILPVQRRDFALADKTLADPNNATRLTDGEWMVINTAYQIVRASDVATPGNLAALPSFPVFAEAGRYDVQAIADRKTDILWLGQYEFDTTIYDAAVTLGSGGPIGTVLQPLKVATVTIGTRNFIGLVGHGGSADTDPIVGYVTRLPANNGNRLRFRNGSRH